MNPKGKEIYMYILGALVVIAAFSFGIAMIFKEVPSGSKDAVMLSAGILLGMAVTVVSYFFGSSKSSADKNEMLGDKITNKVEDIKKELK